MAILRWHNRRGISSLVTLALVVMAFVPWAQWQCLDGTPCPMGMAMAAPAYRGAAPPTAPSHACCHAAAGIARGTRSGAAGIRAAMGCVLRLRPAPEAQGPQLAHVLLIETPADLPSYCIAPPAPPLSRVITNSSTIPRPSLCHTRIAPRAPPAFVS